MLNVVHYPAMEGGMTLVNDQAYYVSDRRLIEVLIHSGCLGGNKKQADSFKARTSR